MLKTSNQDHLLSELLSVKEALKLILAAVEPLNAESIDLVGAANRILAQDVIASTDFPPFTNSSMDGFAVIASDGAILPARLKIIGDIPAGVVSEKAISSGQTARVMTGAPIPDGSDAVVPIENTDLFQQRPGTDLPDSVTILKPVHANDFIRPKGQDIKKGTIVLKKGRRLQPQDIGLLASLGMADIYVYTKPRVALLVTGDELISPSEPLLPGKIRDANSYILTSLIEQSGGDVIPLGIGKDDPTDIKNRLDNAKLKKADIIVTSAGISVGAYDYLRPVVSENGVLQFWRVNMRPGKPLAFGSYDNIPLVGLPGNPVSAYVGFLVFILPAIRKMAGLCDADPIIRKAILAEKIESDGRESYLRAILSVKKNRVEAVLSGHQGSGNIFALVQANALLIIPSGVISLPVGSEVDCILLNPDGGV